MLLQKIQQYRGAIIVFLTLTAITLFVFNLFDAGYISWEFLATNKDSISSVTNIVTAFIFILGALFSYYRFFHGRTFAVRAEASIEVGVHDTASHYHLHSINARIKNIGTAPIWEPKPKLWIELHGPDEFETIRVIEDEWFDGPGQESLLGEKGTLTVVETEEYVSFFVHQQIPKQVWAASYYFKATSSSNHVWTSSTTVSNIPSTASNQAQS